MKRVFLLILVLLLLPLYGCKENSNQVEHPITVYYKRAEPNHGSQDSVIAPGIIEGKNYENDYSYLLSRYLKGSEDPQFAKTFPRGTTLVSFKTDALTAKIVLSDRFASLSGMDLTIACVCLTRTVMELTGCQEVIISAQTAKLDGEKYITLSADSYLLIDAAGVK